MNCCNANGDCTQGRDCPVRKRRMEATNTAYAERGIDTDPYNDVAETFKALIVFIAVTAAMTLLAFIFWGR
jgi:hypothetical protein